MSTFVFERREYVELPDYIMEHIHGEPINAFMATVDGELCFFVRYLDDKGRSHLKPFTFGKGK